MFEEVWRDILEWSNCSARQVVQIDVDGIYPLYHSILGFKAGKPMAKTTGSDVNMAYQSW